MSRFQGPSCLGPIVPNPWSMRLLGAALLVAVLLLVLAGALLFGVAVQLGQ